MKRRSGVLWAVLVLVLAGIVFVYRDRIHFDWANFKQQLQHIHWGHAIAGIVLIYGTYWLRAIRWSVLVRPTKDVKATALVGPQFIGFTAVALFGRLADLTRPYLVARKIELPLSSQVAVYTLDRMFDLGAAALIFSTALAFMPKDMPHQEIFLRTGLISLAVTLAIAVFAGVVRVSGGAVAGFARTVLRPLSKNVAESIAEKITGFRDGLNALKSWREFAVVAGISLLMWGMIASAYVQTAHAFVETPELGQLSFSRAMLLMAASIGGSLLQLPIVGWFTQIAVTAAAMHTFYGAPIEAATACGALLLVVTFFCIIPAGLVCAQLEQVSLRKITTESEEAGKEPAVAQE
ncbi:lysylphosphatidylglycerol synthase transmembrane domain-containing protein [Edaphobacter albus]|uniref:lysylphosphatidylglycerol synthase transmembrane domain-containing protein n=1 Tax=Edaphobacter sp. 4G125 TaxID=2763071 RepID=UPI00164520D2|nr:lysylphosphatidylglycerol synthase transmembrane domain-containing protein [Edaphobacter sp. 4G125]QNI36520.1 flippase-like domain-containing protein [Edaphobacter sp. 4G125]